MDRWGGGEIGLLVVTHTWWSMHQSRACTCLSMLFLFSGQFTRNMHTIVFVNFLATEIASTSFSVYLNPGAWIKLNITINCFFELQLSVSLFFFNFF